MQREEERKKDGSKVIEVRRQPNTGQGGDRRNRDRGSRSSIDRNGPDRSAGRGASLDSVILPLGLVRSVMAFSEGAVWPAGKAQAARHEEEPAPAVANEPESVAADEAKSTPVPEPASQRCVIVMHISAFCFILPAKERTIICLCEAGRPILELLGRLAPLCQQPPTLVGMYGEERRIGQTC